MASAGDDLRVHGAGALPISVEPTRSCTPLRVSRYRRASELHLAPPVNPEREEHRDAGAAQDAVVALAAAPAPRTARLVAARE